MACHAPSFLSPLLTRALALLTTASACGGDGTSAVCSPYSACGGDPVGEWDVGSCLDDETLPPDDECPDLRAERTMEVTGSYTFRDDMTYEFAIESTLSLDAYIPMSCQAGRACEEDEECVAEGDECHCRFTIVDADDGAGTWSTSGSTLELTFDDGAGGETDSASFCVEGDVMKVRVDYDGPPVPIAGAYVLERR